MPLPTLRSPAVSIVGLPSRLSSSHLRPPSASVTDADFVFSAELGLNLLFVSGQPLVFCRQQLAPRDRMLVNHGIACLDWRVEPGCTTLPRRTNCDLPDMQGEVNIRSDQGTDPYAGVEVVAGDASATSENFLVSPSPPWMDVNGHQHWYLPCRHCNTMCLPVLACNCLAGPSTAGSTQG